ncbi:uncharacterized protein L969DRAFT_89182 [Mixia osmundae IAM 14324]|nr:uncharacterized protein L969DRAFT_89182 [Mixia osmundae IAM 14324]KEI37944.1 hypothetical protein L969DRAFT_89182 [Mixia osmundae IAM 14324]
MPSHHSHGHSDNRTSRPHADRHHSHSHGQSRRHSKPAQPVMVQNPAYMAGQQIQQPMNQFQPVYMTSPIATPIASPMMTRPVSHAQPSYLEKDMSPAGYPFVLETAGQPVQRRDNRRRNLLIIIIVAVVVILAIAIGAGVGVSQHKKHSSVSKTSSGSSNASSSSADSSDSSSSDSSGGDENCLPDGTCAGSLGPNSVGPSGALDGSDDD